MAGRQRRRDERQGVGELLLELPRAAGDAAVEVGDGRGTGWRRRAATPNGTLVGDGGDEGSRARAPPDDHEEHELAGPDGQPGPLEQREEAALGVDLVDELAGDADGVLDERGVLLDGGVEVDVLLAPRQVEDVGQLLLAVVDAREEPDDEEGEAAADERPSRASWEPLIASRSRSATSRGARAPGPCGRRGRRRRPGGRPVPAGALKAEAGTSMPRSCSLSRNFGRRPVATSSPAACPPAPGTVRYLKMSWRRIDVALEALDLGDRGDHAAAVGHAGRPGG